MSAARFKLLKKKTNTKKPQLITKFQFEGSWKFPELVEDTSKAQERRCRPAAQIAKWLQALYCYGGFKYTRQKENRCKPKMVPSLYKAVVEKYIQYYYHNYCGVSTQELLPSKNWEF